MALPVEKFNSTHIAVESSGFGCDELRTYILSNLANCGADSLDCLICKETLEGMNNFLKELKYIIRYWAKKQRY